MTLTSPVLLSSRPITFDCCAVNHTLPRLSIAIVCGSFTFASGMAHHLDDLAPAFRSVAATRAVDVMAAAAGGEERLFAWAVGKARRPLHALLRLGRQHRQQCRSSGNTKHRCIEHSLALPLR